MEVSLESSFQPTIQLYLLFPVLVQNVSANDFSLRGFGVREQLDRVVWNQLQILAERQEREEARGGQRDREDLALR